MYYPDYLIHYNKNHSAKNGQFTSGDGDGDGISNDHAHIRWRLVKEKNMYYPDYLIHYNKNHSAKNGQFVSGDGDGDGISNDHAHRSKKKVSKRSSGKKTSSRKKISDKEKKKRAYNAAFDDPFSLQNMQKYTARADIFCNSYKKYGLSKAIDITSDFATVDNFLQSLARKY